jgi:hypothetical protein
MQVFGDFRDTQGKGKGTQKSIRLNDRLNEKAVYSG